MQKLLAASTLLLTLALGIMLWVLDQSREPRLDPTGGAPASSLAPESSLPRRSESSHPSSSAEAREEDQAPAEETKAAPDFVLRGHVRFLDLASREIEPLASTMTLLFLGEDIASMERRSIAVEAGRFSLPLVGADLVAVMIESLSVGEEERPARLEGKRYFELASFADHEVELDARLEARILLRVLDAANGRDLHEVTLRTMKTRGGEERVVTGNSPFLLDLDQGRVFNCAAPGRVPVEVVLDDRSDGERIVVLARGGGLHVNLESDLEVLPPGRGLKLVLTDLVTQKSREIFSTRVFPARCDLEALPPGAQRLEAILTKLLSSESVIFARDLTIKNGQLTEVSVRVKAEDLDRNTTVKVRGSFLLPRAVEGFAYRSGFVEDAWGRRVPSSLGFLEQSTEQPLELRFEAFDLGPGDYRACLGNESFPFRVAAGEDQDLRFELNAPGRLELVIPGIAGDLADSWINLSWWSARQSQVPVRAREDGVFVIEAGPGPIEVEVGGSMGRSRHHLEIPIGTQQVTLDTKLSFLAIVRLESRGTVICDDALLEVEVYAEDGQRISNSGYDGRELNFQLPQAGRHRIRLPRAPAGYLIPDDLLIDLLKPRNEVVIELRPRW